MSRKRPYWQSRQKEVQDACRILLFTTCGNAATGIHRDFHPGQVLWDGETVQFVDFDLFATGDPAVDAGNFLAHLQELAIRVHGDVHALAHHESGFLRGYLNCHPDVSFASIEALTQVSLALHIYISTRFSGRRHATERIPDACERQLHIPVGQDSRTRPADRHR